MKRLQPTHPHSQLDLARDAQQEPTEVGHLEVGGRVLNAQAHQEGWRELGLVARRIHCRQDLLQEPVLLWQPVGQAELTALQVPPAEDGSPRPLPAPTADVPDAPFPQPVWDVAAWAQPGDPVWGGRCVGGSGVFEHEQVMLAHANQITGAEGRLVLQGNAVVRHRGPLEGLQQDEATATAAAAATAATVALAVVRILATHAAMLQQHVRGEEQHIHL